MNMGIQNVIGKVSTIPGQGSILEQINKLLRKQQRTNLFEMLEQIDKRTVEKFPVVLFRPGSIHHTKES